VKIRADELGIVMREAVAGALGYLGNRMGAEQVQQHIAKHPKSVSSRALASVFDFQKPLLKDPDAKYLDEKQLCAELGISPVTATKWRAQAEGPPFVRVGRLIRYARTAVDAWVANRTVGK